MKAVMKSVSPRICEKVASGDCTILVSKTAPKCGTPFKGYIYATNGEMLFDVRREIYLPPKVRIKPFRLFFGKSNDALYPSIPIVNRKVIGEFICDKIIEWQYDRGHQYYVEYPDDCTSYFPYLKCHSEATGLKCSEIEEFGKGKTLYGWHISDLKIYDKPKELSEFANALSNRDIRCKHIEKRQTVNGRQYMKCTLQNCICEFRRLGWQTDCIGYEMLKERKPITRAPQSWCYVEEL